jgi:tetratricopeptide (TPR) repeat protein
VQIKPGPSEGARLEYCSIPETSACQLGVAMIRLVVTVVLVVATVVAPAWGQIENENWAQCLNSDADISIKGCTAIINSRGELPADLVIAFRGRGNAYLSKSQYDRAIEDYSEAIRRKSDDASSLSNRGTAYLSKGDYARAIEDFNQSLRVDPESAGAFYNRGNAYFSKGEYDRAIEDYSKSLQLDPSNARALFARGVAKQQMVDLAGAAADKAAARKIDPDVADKVLKTGKAVAPVAVAVALPQALSESTPPADNADIPADCVVLPGGLLDLSTQTRSTRDAPVTTYVDEPLEQLKKAVPALRRFKFDADKSADGSTVAGAADDVTASILSQTGGVVAAMLRVMPNLSAREEVRPVSDPTPDVSDGLPQNGRIALSSGPNSPPSSKDSAASESGKAVFSYRIVVRQDPVFGHVLDEYRTDANSQPIADSADSSDDPHSVGFGTTWLIFFPGNLNESRFRYLGRQKIGDRETYVLAFAQIPGRTRLRTVVHVHGDHCSTDVQGVAWIDQSTFRIVRMQTDLLSPLSSIQLNQLRSTVNYSEVTIPQHDLSLWLPNNVEIVWRTVNQAGGERHRYSNYKLFEATSTIFRTDGSPLP